MSRKLKNIIMISLLVVLLGGFGYTIYKAKDSASNSYINNPEMMERPGMQGNMGTPPDMNDKRGRMGKSSEKPIKDMKNNNNNNNNENSEMPTQPDMNGEKTNNPPELPNEENNGNENNMMKRNINDMPRMFDNITNENAEMDSIYIVLLGLESFLITILVLYLIMSKFNSKNFKETFPTNERIIIYALSVIIVTCLLTGISYFIINTLL